MIHFYGADVSNPLKDRKQVRKWLTNVAQSAQYSIVELNYVFCSDAYLLEMNKQFLQHDYFTDIITFPTAELPAEVCGECYISIDRVRDNAKEMGCSFVDELHRVMVHGLWHLMGQGDKTPSEAAAMRSKENESLNLRMFHVEQSESTKIKQA